MPKIDWTIFEKKYVENRKRTDAGGGTYLGVGTNTYTVERKMEGEGEKG